MKRKLLIICEALGGGVRKHIVDVLENLPEEKYDIAIAYGEKRADQIFMDFIQKNQERFTLFPITDFVREVNVFQDIKTIFKLIKIMKSYRPDIVHCHSSKAGGAGRLATLFYRPNKLLYTPHGYILQYPNVSRKKIQVYATIERFLSRITDYTINVSKGEQAVGIKYNLFESHKSVIIYNGVVENSLTSKVIEKRKFIIGTLARFDHSKDPKTFLEISKRIIEYNPNIEVWYAGNGEYFKEEFLKEIENIPQIKYCGFLTSTDQFLDEIDIYLSTSLHEGLPYSVIEAMSKKKPVIATNVVGNNELVINGYNGYLFAPGNVDEAVTFLIKIITDKEKYGEFQKSSYQLFKDNFEISKMIQALEKIYES